MKYERTPVALTIPVALAEVKVHLRVSFDDADAHIETLTRTAALEVEEQCGLALLTTTIAATTDQWPGQVIDLPVGPVQADATASVAVLGTDGTATPVTDGFWLETGRYPRLHVSDIAPGWRLRIVYSAGFGDTAADVPVDLRLAIAEQALRLYDESGSIKDKGPSLSHHTARIIARYRRVAI